MTFKNLLLLLITLFLEDGVFSQLDLENDTCKPDQRRPFYLIGHMVNGINQIDDFLNAGCNAIEADVTFKADGIAWKTYHGSPCDCYRICNYESDLFEYLEYAQNITTPGNDGYRSSFVLLVLDLKTGGIDTKSLSSAGKIFAN
ncbi:hypothetical protein B4U80_03669, partial [Leptotrombidium deliense]